MSIAAGREDGYSRAAEDVAEEILGDRGIYLTEEEKHLKLRLDSAKADFEARRPVLDRANAAHSTRRLGSWLLIVGGASLLLPLAGLQFRLLLVLGDSLPIISILMIVCGGAFRWEADRTFRTIAAEGAGDAIEDTRTQDVRRTWL
jgi:hypothetical protein